MADIPAAKRFHLEEIDYSDEFRHLAATELGKILEYSNGSNADTLSNHDQQHVERSNGFFGSAEEAKLWHTSAPPGAQEFDQLSGMMSSTSLQLPPTSEILKLSPGLLQQQIEEEEKIKNNTNGSEREQGTTAFNFTPIKQQLISTNPKPHDPPYYYQPQMPQKPPEPLFNYQQTNAQQRFGVKSWPDPSQTYNIGSYNPHHTTITAPPPLIRNPVLFETKLNNPKPQTQMDILSTAGEFAPIRPKFSLQSHALDSPGDFSSMVLNKPKEPFSNRKGEIKILYTTIAEVFWKTSSPLLRGLVIASHFSGYGVEKEPEEYNYKVERDDLFMFSVELFSKSARKNSTKSRINRLKAMKRWIVMQSNQYHKLGRVWKFEVQTARQDAWQHMTQKLVEHPKPIRGYTLDGQEIDFDEPVSVDSPEIVALVKRALEDSVN